jgi:hypothetical protein
VFPQSVDIVFECWPELYRIGARKNRDLARDRPARETKDCDQFGRFSFYPMFAPEYAAAAKNSTLIWGKGL